MCHFVKLNLSRSVALTGRTASWCTQCVVRRGYLLRNRTTTPRLTQKPHKTKRGYTTATGPSTSKIHAAKTVNATCKRTPYKYYEGFCTCVFKEK